MKFEKLNGQNNEPYYMNNIIWTIRYGPKNEAYHTDGIFDHIKQINK